MNNGMPKKTGLLHALRKWLVPLTALLTMSGALLYMFLSMRQTVWCYLTDDVSIRESALDARPRLTVWEEPYRILPARDTSSCAQRPAFTPDGAMMVFSDKQGDDANTHLYASTWNGRKWSKPVSLETIYSSANERDPAITRDGRYLCFASDRPGGSGGYDIWIARWDGVKWTDVANAGPSVNTKYDEVAPAATPDGARLFFSSNRPLSDDEIRVRSAPPGKVSAGRDFDIFAADIKTPGMAASAPATETASPDAAKAAGPGGKQNPAKPLSAGKRAPALKTEVANKNAPADGRAEPPAALPEFGTVRRMDVLNSPADDLNVCFTPRGDMVYFDSNREGGLGGFEVYASRVVLGQLQPPRNLGPEINGPADDRAPAVRMEGFDQLFSSNRGPGNAVKFGLHSSTAREVVSKVDLSRLYLLIGRLQEVRWWILAFIAAIIALIYLIKHFRDLTNLFHKLLVASAIIHMVALLIISSWKIGSQMVEPPALPMATMGEVAISADALAREKMALDLAESVIGQPQAGGGGGGGGGNGGALPKSDITVVAKQAGEFLPMPDFQPQKSSPGVTTVARSTASPVILEDAPSRGQESSGGGDVKPAADAAKGPSGIAEKLDALPEVAAPRVDVVMEDKSPSSEDKTATADNAFQPLMNTPVASTVRVAPAAAVEAVSSVKPINIAAGAEAVAPVTDSGAGAKSLVVGSGAGEGAFDAKNTGGLFARQSGGSDVSSGRPLSGLGEKISARLASSENGTGTGTGSGSGLGGGSGPGMGIGSGGGLGNGAPGAMEVPEGFDDKMSPYMLRKKGKPSTEVVEGLGGSQETETAVSRALEWLAKHQESDGRWSIQKHGGQAGHDVAATGLPLLCYLGWGVKPHEPGKYQLTAAKALEWLSSQVKPDGDARGAGGDMYDHAIATIALAEAYALTKDKDLGSVVRNAVGFIVRAQHPTTGGWRYKPGQTGDTSVVGWVLMALTSARMSGVSVPQETFDLGDKWLTSAGGGEHGGLYGYVDKQSSPSMAAEGMFCRQIMGVRPDDRRMEETADYLQARLLQVGQALDFYYLYYGTLALNQHRGPAWDAWNARLKAVLPPLQATAGDEAGSWVPAGQYGGPMGRVVGTALATLSLEVYYRYMPFAYTKGIVTTTRAATKPAP